MRHSVQFADNAWRSYGLVYAWPLFFYTFFYNPHQVWVVWGVLLTFGVIPVFVLFNGKRYCSWICGCGGLADAGRMGAAGVGHLQVGGVGGIEAHLLQHAQLGQHVVFEVVVEEAGEDVRVLLDEVEDRHVGFVDLA